MCVHYVLLSKGAVSSFVSGAGVRSTLSSAAFCPGSGDFKDDFCPGSGAFKDSSSTSGAGVLFSRSGGVGLVSVFCSASALSNGVFSSVSTLDSPINPTLLGLGLGLGLRLGLVLVLVSALGLG